MTAVLILGGVAALWYMLERQQAEIASLIGTNKGTTSATQSASSVSMQVGSTVASVTANSTDAQITQGFQKALKVDPDPTGISQGLLAIGSQISGIFTAHHADAMKKEAATINSALPTFLKEVQAAMIGLGQGAITEAQTLAYIQQAQTDYYTTVNANGVMKKSGTCTVAADGVGPGKLDHYGCATTANPCNAACCLGCDVVEPGVRGLTKIIKAGGGTYTVPAGKGNGAIQGTPSFTFNYQRPSAAAAAANSLGSSLSSLLAGL